MFHAVVNAKLAFLEDCEVPMIAIIDRHYQYVVLIESFLLEDSLDLVLIF